MSNEPPPEPSKIQQRPNPRPNSLEPIKVKELRFGVDGRSLPLRDCDGTMMIVKAGKGRKGTLVEVQYEPWQRHHRVRETDDGKPISEFCVPESWALYVPLAD